MQLKVLFHLFEQQLDAPALFIEEGYFLGCYHQVIGQKLIFTVLLVLVANPSQGHNLLGAVKLFAVFVLELYSRSMNSSSAIIGLSFSGSFSRTIFITV